MKRNIHKTTRQENGNKSKDGSQAQNAMADNANGEVIAQFISQSPQVQLASERQSMIDAHVRANNIQVQSENDAAPVQHFSQEEIVQRFIGVTSADGDPNVIDQIAILERFPTNARGQGDHTVSEGLATTAIQSMMVGGTYAQALQSLIMMFQDIPEGTELRFDRFDSGERILIGKGALRDEIATYQALLRGGAQVHQLQKQLGVCIETYLRLWNKRDGGAYNRDEKQTSGGGDERLALALLKDWQTRRTILTLQDPDHDHVAHVEDRIRHIDQVATVINSLIDYLGEDEEEEETHIEMAITLALRVYPAMAAYHDELFEVISEGRESDYFSRQRGADIKMAKGGKSGKGGKPG